MKIADIGGSLIIHTFGAYFGLAATYFFQNKAACNAKHAEKSEASYATNLVAYVGTIFLWMFWPSFNGALAEGAAQERCVLNTVLSLTGSVLMAMFVSRVNDTENLLDCEIILNASLAGGVAIGTSADLITGAPGALIVGCIAGVVSALGFDVLSHYLKERIGLHDTCGIHNLHGMPGLIGGITGAIVVATSASAYGDNISNAFPAMKAGRTLQGQAMMQALAILITLAIAIVGGLITGYIASRPIFKPPKHLFDDGEFWAGVKDVAGRSDSAASRGVAPGETEGPLGTEMSVYVSGKANEVDTLRK